MADITLSKAVRSNLLNLQSTADLLGRTQERLATGKKVNSALDNPVNFFTASSLNARAGDMSSLLDSMANGIQTLEAADNGLTAITKTLESMQSTLTQARQDKSFKTESYTLPETGLTAGDTVGFSGGAFTTAPADVNLTKGTAGTSETAATFAAFDLAAADAGTASTVTAANAYTDIDLSANADNEYTFDVDLGGTTANITLDQAGSGGDNVYDIDEAIAAIQAQIDASGIGAGAVTVGKNGAGDTLTFTANNVGATALTIDNVAATGTGITATTADLGISNPTTTGQTDTGTAAHAADSFTFDIDVDGNGASTVTVTAAQVAAAGNGDQTVDDLDELQAVVEAALAADGVTGVTVSQNDAGDALVFSSETLGTASSVAITNGTFNDNSGSGAVIANTGFDTLNEATGAADGGDAKTVDELVTEINDANGPYAGFVRASNDDGKLRIENLSTQDLTISKPTSVTGSTDIGGNEVRADLATQYNELRDQLDKLADDASFNGINLLRGDNLRLTFNETGTSSIDIQTRINGVSGESINAGTLGIDTFMEASELDSDDTIDGFISEIKSALGTVRSQSSAFGSNLSIVENRQDFTKNMVNTLETGASNLTLADTNEEAANMLALQTRQQLSSTALSLASQADQNVLRLF